MSDGAGGMDRGGVRRSSWSRVGLLGAVVVLVVAVAGWARATRGGEAPAGSVSADPATRFYPLFGDLPGVRDPAIGGRLQPTASGRRLPMLNLADAEGSAPTVATLTITDSPEIEQGETFTDVTIRGTTASFHTQKPTYTNYATGTEEPTTWIDSRMLWPIGGGLWADLHTTLRNDGKATDRTRQIAQGITFVDLSSWPARYRTQGAETTPSSALPDTTTSGSIPDPSGPPSTTSYGTTTAGP